MLINLENISTMCVCLSEQWKTIWSLWGGDQALCVQRLPVRPIGFLLPTEQGIVELDFMVLLFLACLCCSAMAIFLSICPLMDSWSPLFSVLSCFPPCGKIDVKSISLRISLKQFFWATYLIMRKLSLLEFDIHELILEPIGGFANHRVVFEKL